MFSILKPYIFSLDPEAAHDLAIKSLKANFLPKSFFAVKEEELLETNLFKKTLCVSVVSLYTIINSLHDAMLRLSTYNYIPNMKFPIIP